MGRINNVRWVAVLVCVIFIVALLNVASQNVRLVSPEVHDGLLQMASTMHSTVPIFTDSDISSEMKQQVPASSSEAGKASSLDHSANMATQILASNSEVVKANSVRQSDDMATQGLASKSEAGRINPLDQFENNTATSKQDAGTPISDGQTQVISTVSESSGKVLRGPAFLPDLVLSTADHPLQFVASAVKNLRRAYDTHTSKYPHPQADTAVSDNFDRRPSYPFNSADGFRAMCKHKCDGLGCRFRPAAVQKGDCIYLAGTNLKRTHTATVRALEEYSALQSQIEVAHIIVSGSGDLSMPDGDNWHLRERPEALAVWRKNFSNLLDTQSLIAWFASNCHWNPESAPKPVKLHCIPIGIENRWGKIGKDPLSYLSFMRPLPPFRHRQKLLVDFKPGGRKPFRKIALEGLKGSWITFTKKKLDRGAWVKLVQAHQWVACPPGHGYDTHRVWEVLLHGSLPVVQSTSMDSLYEGLPILIVSKWTDVTEELLDSFVKTLHFTNWSYDRVFHDFWKRSMIEKGLVL